MSSVGLAGPVLGTLVRVWRWPGCRQAPQGLPIRGSPQCRGKAVGPSGQAFPVSGLQEGWLNIGRGVSSGSQQNSLCVDSVDLLLACFPCLFFFFFVGELLQVVFGADVSERLVMGSVREVSGLGGGPGAAVAVSLAEGGWPRTGAVARGRTGPWAGAPLGASGSSGRSPSSASVVVQGRAVWAPGSRQEWTVGQPE